MPKPALPASASPLSLSRTLLYFSSDIAAWVRGASGVGLRASGFGLRASGVRLSRRRAVGRRYHRRPTPLALLRAELETDEAAHDDALAGLGRDLGDELLDRLLRILH